MKLNLHEFAGPRFHFSKTLRAKNGGSKTPRGKEQSLRGVNLPSLPCRVLDQCNLCPAKSRRHNFRGQNRNI